MTNDLLADMARQRLWVASYSIDDRGEVAFDVDGLDVLLDGNCRLGARGKTSGYSPFALCTSLDEANEVCDMLLKHMTKIARANGRRPPRSLERKVGRLFGMQAARALRQRQATAAPAREPGEEG